MKQIVVRPVEKNWGVFTYHNYAGVFVDDIRMYGLWRACCNLFLFTFRHKEYTWRPDDEC